MDTQTPIQTRTPPRAYPLAHGRQLEMTTPDCLSERLWTALSARWLGRCREQKTMEHETS